MTIVQLESGSVVRVLLALATSTIACNGKVDTPFTCGDAAICHSSTQFCRSQPIGDTVDASTLSYCDEIPSGCSSDQTCGCIQDSGIPNSKCSPAQIKQCSQSGNAMSVVTDYSCGPPTVLDY